MSTPTADELASVIHRICRDSVIDGTPGIHVVHKVGDLLTTYAAQVRRDALTEFEQAGRMFASVMRAKKTGADNVMDALCEASAVSVEDFALNLRRLPPGSPSSQTDTGDNNV